MAAQKTYRVAWADDPAAPWPTWDFPRLQKAVAAVWKQRRAYAVDVVVVDDAGKVVWRLSEAEAARGEGPNAAQYGAMVSEKVAAVAAAWDAPETCGCGEPAVDRINGTYLCARCAGA